MKNEKVSGAVWGARAIVLTAAVILILVLVAAAIVVAINGDTGEMSSREDITLKMEELGESDLGHRYVANHLEEFGIGGYDAGKLRNVEYYFKSLGVAELGDIPSMAYKTAELFMEYYYNRVDHSDREKVTTSIIHCFVEQTGDVYAVYRTAEELEDFTTDMSGNFVGIGVQVIQTVDPATGLLSSVYVEDVIAGSGAEEAGIKPGDLILSVDGSPITENDNHGLVSKIRGEENTTVAIGVDRGGEQLTFNCTRRLVVEKTVEYRVEGGIGIITITSFKENTPELFAEALSYVYSVGVKGIVFDMRDNPGGYLDAVLNMVDAIAPADVTLTSIVDNEGLVEEYGSTGEGRVIDVPVVVLCNGNTASAGELFTSSIRDFAKMGIMDATIVGTKTYGKGVMQSTYSFFDGSSITLTTAFYNPPSGENYDGIGITPDEVVATAEGSVDNQLQRAIEIIELKLGSNDQASL